MNEDAALEGPWAQAIRLAFGFLFAAVLVAAGAWLVSNVQRIPPDSRALVLRFGSLVREQGPGLLVAWPKPVERIVLLPSADQQIEMKIDRFESEASAKAPTAPIPGEPRDTGVPAFGISDDPRENTGFLLTGDRAVVHLSASVFYRITDPASYLVERDHVPAALERAVIAASLAVTSGRNLDSIIVAHTDDANDDRAAAGREQLRADLAQEIDRRLDALAQQGVGLGVTVDRVDLVPAIPAGAKEAFDLVLIATQAAEQGIAEARTAAETTAQRANQDSDRIRADAQAGAAEEIQTAQTATASISALTRQMQGVDGGMLLTRVYNDRMAALLNKVGHVELVDPATGGHTILPGTIPK